MRFGADGIPTLYQVWDLTMAMIGQEESAPSFRAKAAETHGLLKFVVSVFDMYQSSLESCKNGELKMKCAYLRHAGHSAITFDAILQSNPGNKMSEDNIRSLLHAFLDFGMLYERAGGDLVHKFHLMIHGVQKIRKYGNLKHCTTNKFESYNGVLARIAERCHRRSWYEDIFWRAHLLDEYSLGKSMH